MAKITDVDVGDLIVEIFDHPNCTATVLQTEKSIQEDVTRKQFSHYPCRVGVCTIDSYIEEGYEGHVIYARSPEDEVVQDNKGNIAHAESNFILVDARKSSLETLTDEINYYKRGKPI